MHRKPAPPAGFTLIELVMLIILVGIVAAIAIPNFIDYRADAKNAAVTGLVGSLRAAVGVAVAAIALNEASSPPTPMYPTLLEMRANSFSASHPILNGKKIMDPDTGIPDNPWSDANVPPAVLNSIADAVCDATPTKLEWMLYCPAEEGGWVYLQTTGEIWAGTGNNNGPGQWDCTAPLPYEACY